MPDPQSALDLADDSGHPRALSLAELLQVARDLRPVALLEEGMAKRPLERAMAASRAWVADQASGRGGAAAVYGVNTGFGALAGRARLDGEAGARSLMYNLVASHAAGAGPDLSEEVVRAALLIRARQLAGGQSGLRVAVVNRLLGLLNHRLLPRVPRMGSLGASGDLAPLAHVALAICQAPADVGESARTADERVRLWVLDAMAPSGADAADGPAPAAEARSAMPASLAGPVPDTSLSQASLAVRQGRADHRSPAQPAWRLLDRATALAPIGGPVVLEAKEGLALTNGASVSAALLALALADARRLLAHAELAAAMVLEAVGGFRDPFLAPLLKARPHPGALAVGRRVLAYVAGSERLDPADLAVDPAAVPPQDFYSLRCAPQVLGAGWDALAFAEETLEREINSAVDNPLIVLDLPRAYKALSGGNFHGAPLGYALDLLKVVVTDCASMSERRTFKLTDYRRQGSKGQDVALPPFLVRSPEGREGYYSGLMIAQYTAASLVSAAKTLSHPDSVDSIPSSAGQEDHVSMSMNAGLHARAVVQHAEAVLAIELICAGQAMELSDPGRPAGAGTAAALACLRTQVGPWREDRFLQPDIAAALDLLRKGALLTAARQAAGLPVDGLDGAA